MSEAVLLGEGELSWPKDERVSDRYGVVSLQVAGRRMSELEMHQMLASPANERIAAANDVYCDFEDAPVGKRGLMFAEVIENRKPYHIGDMFNGFFPDPALVGERVDLGYGELIREEGWRDLDMPRMVIGLEPVMDEREFEDRKIGRGIFWLNPRSLFRVHAQVVKLWFQEATNRQSV